MPNLSVDPGYKGSIAIWGERVAPIPMPVLRVGSRHTYDLAGIVAIVRINAPKRVVVEQVTRPGVLVGNMNFIIGVAMALGADVTRIRPQEWRKVVGLKDGERKDASIRLALSLYPHLAEYIKKKSDDGLSEAVLLGHAVFMTEEPGSKRHDPYAAAAEAKKK